MKRLHARGWMPLSALALAMLAACGGDDNNSAGNTPATPGTPETPQAAFQAEIRRTTMGVPHIKANDWSGLGYGYGYAQAQDNLCTMADSFLTYRGERSRHFGASQQLVASSTIGRPRNIDSDFFHRHILSDDTIQAMTNAQPPELQALVKGFTAGYNRYLRELGANGGTHAACAGQAWVTAIRPEDVYRRMFAANLAGGYSNFVPNIANAVPPSAAPVARAPSRAALRLMAQRTREPALQVGGKEGVGSNMIGFGTGGSATGAPLLFGNPHWYWRGPDRFYQAQLTIPGTVDVSGTSFLGIPVILIGFNKDVAWSHTVSTARRFGFFQLTLASGDPTSYMRDGQPVKMKAVPITVQVKQPDGSLSNVSRTLYRSEYGPLVNLGLLNPALAWNQSMAFAIRDINADNFRTFRNWLRWNRAKSLDEFIAIQREEAAIPWVNTVAIGRGSQQAWYADIGAMPNASPDLLRTCAAAVAPALASALPRVPVLDGSRSACDWQNDADSVQKGAIGPARMPSLLRDDYVANMNDSYWMSNPKAPLTGFPDIIGPAGASGAALSMRTRMGHLLAQQRIDGTDGYGPAKASVDSVKQMVLNSRVLTAELFKDDALAAVCTAPQVSISGDPLTNESFAARNVDIAQACEVLRAWNNTGNTEARGAHIWDEFWARASLLPASKLYTVQFDANDALRTPRGLKTDNPTALQQAFGAAVLKVQQSGFAPDAPRGDTLFATRGGQKVRLFGGCGGPGYFTIACSENRIQQGGYSMDGDPNGNSYMQIVSFADGKVEAHTFLTFSLSDDPASAHNGDYTKEYAAKRWAKMPFTEAEITGNPDFRTVTLSE